MRRTLAEVPILTGNQLPGPRRIAPSTFKGQLYLEHTSGTYYRAKSAGPEAEWEVVFVGTAEEITAIIEDKVEEYLIENPAPAGEGLNVILVDDTDWPPPPDSNPLNIYMRVAP